MRRALSLTLAAILVIGIGVTSSPRVAVAAGPVRPHAEVSGCPSGKTHIATRPDTEQEAAYNDDLVLCDWGYSEGHYRFSFKNDSPVVWAFYDTNQTDEVPSYGSIYHDPTGIAPLFWRFATAYGIAHSEWIVAPGETVWLDSLIDVSFGLAQPVLATSWLFYKQQADKIVKLGKDYAKRIATTGYASKTRQFLWDCAAAGVTTDNALKADDEDVIVYAANWATAAKTGGECIQSFTHLFPKKVKKLPSSTYSVGKWFNSTEKVLSKASTYLDDIRVSRQWIAGVIGLFRAVRL
jgi:hypothetical protein